MRETVRIELRPSGKIIECARGTSLQDALYGYGVEFPCGGRGHCRACRIKILSGSLPIDARQKEAFSLADLAEGWRLACRCSAEMDLAIELAQWETPVLADETPLDFAMRDGLAAAVDLGTTTLAAQLLDLKKGHVLDVRTALNPQAKRGADVMSRISFAERREGAAELREAIRRAIGAMLRELCDEHAGGQPLESVAIVGNTAMHHLFCGIDIAPLARYPFEPENDGLIRFRAGELGWRLPGDPPVRFLPCMGGFVGSDVLAGVMAAEMIRSKALLGLIDLGTNGEIVIGSRERLLCASTAAGPAFEGANISSGMRAAAGAISAVEARGGRLRCHVIGDGPPRGVCGSGLVDAIAAGLDLGTILPTGRLDHGADRMPLCPPVSISQADVRQMQLAKGAIAAGVQILLERLGAKADDLERVYIAGAFGNYVNLRSANRIGMLPFPIGKAFPAGNTALQGAKIALFADPSKPDPWNGILERMEHVPLSADPRFQEIYVEQMLFPELAPESRAAGPGG